MKKDLKVKKTISDIYEKLKLLKPIKEKKNNKKLEKFISKMRILRPEIINSVSVKITLQIGILIIAICSILGAVSYNSSYKALGDTIESSLKSKASESAKLINSILEQDIKVMSVLAERPEIKSMNVQSQIPVLLAEAQRLNYVNLNIMDLNGIIYFSNGEKTRIDIENISRDNEYLKKALSGIPAVSDPVTNTEGEQIIAVAVPIKDKDDKVSGVLFSNMSTKNLNEIVQKLKRI